MYIRNKTNLLKTTTDVSYQTYRRNYNNSSCSDTTSSSSTSSSTNNTPLKRFNRTFRSSVARYWPYFRKEKFSKCRGRSVSDAGLCSVIDNADPETYLEMPTANNRRPLHVSCFGGIRFGRGGSESTLDQSFSVLYPALFVTSTAGTTSVVGAEDASDGSDVDSPKKTFLRVPSPAVHGQSTGNFASPTAGGGCGAPRSAPATPLQIDPHPRPSKYDKHATKPLSGSAPSVRTEITATSDTVDGKQLYKSRQKKFQRHFPQVGPEERVLNYYACALVGDLLLQGHLYITKNYFAFYSNVFGYVTKLLIPTTSVLRITKEKVARIIPNAVGVCTRDERHVFGSLLSRDSTYKLMLHVWKAAKMSELAPEPPELRSSEVELDASEFSPDEDSSSGACEPPDPPSVRRESEAIVNTGGAAVIQPALLAGSSVLPVRRTSWYRRFLVTTACLLTITAAYLAHALLTATTPHHTHVVAEKLSGEQLYWELVRWKATLHGRAATELHDYLSTNLMLLTKVRQSLETLSGVILTDMAHMKADVPNDTRS